MDLASFASTPSAGGSTSSWSEDQIAFVTACRDLKIRLSYGGLSMLKLPEATAGLNRGRHGSNIVKSLPLAAQPAVCRADGTYHPKAAEAFESIDDFNAEDGAFTAEVDGKAVTGLQAVSSWKLIPQKSVLGAYAQFQADRAAAAEASEAEETED